MCVLISTKIVHYKTVFVNEKMRIILKNDFFLRQEKFAQKKRPIFGRRKKIYFRLNAARVRNSVPAQMRA